MGNDDARSLDHKTLEALRIRAVGSVQAGESPSAVDGDADQKKIQHHAGRPVGRLLAQIGIACQKPLHRAIEHDESLVRQWLKHEYPKIQAMAKNQGADMGGERRTVA